MGEPTADHDTDDEACSHAPEHVIDMLLSVMRSAPRPSPMLDSVAAARAARAEAKIWADRIWSEAFMAGAAWWAAREPARMEIRFDGSNLSADQVAEVIERNARLAPPGPR